MSQFPSASFPPTLLRPLIPREYAALCMWAILWTVVLLYATVVWRPTTKPTRQRQILLLFVDKIRHAQNAGFAAAIVYDDQLDRSLIIMDGNAEGINIHAVFVSKVAGEFLKLYAQVQDGNCCVIPPIPDSPDSDNSHSDNSWRYLGIYIGCCLSFMLVSFVLIFYAQDWWDWCRQRRSRSRVNIDSRTVEASPRMDTVTVQEAFPHLETVTVESCPRRPGHRSNQTCAIFLKNYREGEFINTLPCKHEFHSRCMASWLAKGGTLCPVCSLDVRTIFTNPGASRTSPDLV